MKIEQFPKTTNVFRLVVDRHGKVLRHLWAGQCFAANVFKQDTEIKDYEEEEINSTQFFKSVVSVEYNARDIADLESGDPDRDWSSEKMVFKVDGLEHYTYNPETKNSDTWPFEAEQYILLNIAIQPGIDANITSSKMELSQTYLISLPIPD